MAYSKEAKETIFKEVFDKVSKGAALRTVLKGEGMPDAVTFYKWLDKDEDKIKQYARATSERADSIFEDMLDIADDQEGDVYIDKDGNEQVNHNINQRARLRVDTRKWYLSKLAPKKYGDKQAIEHIFKESTPFKSLDLDVPEDNSAEQDSES